MRCSYWLFGTLAIVVSTFGLTPTTYGQVNGTGPSDPGLFDVVLNVSDSEREISRSFNGETLQVNLFEGGSVTNGLQGFSPSVTTIPGIEVNVDGVTFSDEIQFGTEVNIISGSATLGVNSGGQANILGGDSLVMAGSGSDVNVSGGSIRLTVGADSSVRVSGGSFANLWLGSGNSGNLVLSGGEFALNGNPILGPSVEFAERDVLTGTLEDGSAVVLGPFSPSFSNVVTNFNGPGNTISLNVAPLPPVDLAPIVVNTTNPDIPFGLRTGQTLTLQEGGRLESSFQASGATLNVEGGSLGGAFRHIVVDSTVNVSGGFVRGFLLAFDGTVVNVTGGLINDLFVDRGSQANTSGGGVGDLSVLEGGEATISGGTIGTLRLLSGSTTELIGGEFKLNGENFDGTTVTLEIGDELTGTLADGSPFVFNNESTFFGPDVIVETVLSRVALPEIDRTPIIVDANTTDLPLGLRAGQELTLVDGGELGSRIVDATLNVEGGILIGGTVASRSEVNVSGGIVRPLFVAGTGSVVNISGGKVEIGFAALEDSVVNISGGEIDPAFRANPGSEVNLFGTEFFIDGVAVNFVDDESILILDRDVTLSGTLLDGESFEFELNVYTLSFEGNFFPDATLTVNLGSAESPVLGDVNGDGSVDFLDISPFISALSTGEFQVEADINQDGEVNFLDISPFIGLLVGQ